MFEDDQQCQTLQLQLAVTLDAGNPFVTGTYSLEGGGEAIGIAYRTLQEISIAKAVQNYSKTIVVAQEIAGGNQTEAEWSSAYCQDLCSTSSQVFPGEAEQEWH